MVACLWWPVWLRPKAGLAAAAAKEGGPASTNATLKRCPAGSQDPVHRVRLLSRFEVNGDEYKVRTLPRGSCGGGAGAVNPN